MVFCFAEAGDVRNDEEHLSLDSLQAASMKWEDPEASNDTCKLCFSDDFISTSLSFYEYYSFDFPYFSSLTSN